MSSKRMSISALLSNDSSASPQPPSPAPLPTSDEPPLKRQRHQVYTQQYYDSYKAYPYSPATPSSPTTRYYSPLQLQHQSQQKPQSPQSGSPNTTLSTMSQTWPPPHASTSHQESRPQWDSHRYPSPVSVSATGAFDFARPHRPTSNLRGAEDEESAGGGRQAHFHPQSIGKGQSLVSVLTDQMRAPHTHTALPAPPQLRRDAQHPHHSHVAPTAVDSPNSAPVRSRDASPLAVKIATPNTTPPSLSPQSSYTPQNPSPTTSYARHSVSPMAYASQIQSPTVGLRQNVSPTTYTSPKASPTTTHPPARSSPLTQYAPNISPIAPQATHISPSTSYTPASASPPTSYPAPQHPRLPSPRAPVVSPVSEHVRSSPAPPPVQLTEPQQSPPKLSQSTVVDADDERSFEDELLSLVDGGDVKPKIPRNMPSSPPVEPPGSSLERKPSGSYSKSNTKQKVPSKSRAPAKSSKAKAAVRQGSGPGTPVPTSSMPPPSPMSTKQPPAAVRSKGKGSATKKKAAGSALARSRSLSVKPAEPILTPAPDVEMTHEEDRLYCVCRTPYDEDKIMIACDRCDEWYHPACVAMPEVEVDLVDQYICELCRKKHAGLQTTYKQRCHRGLKHIASHDSLPTCWKPARGAFSKYCSDDCGIAHMRAKVLQSGRDPVSLWSAVKNARKREGITVTNGPVKMEEQDGDKDMERRKVALVEARKALKEADERELGELLHRLDEIMSAREACKGALERVVMRRRLLDLAVDRAAGRYCGWDVRLEMSDEEWKGWTTTDEGRRALEGKEAEDEQWWCQGPEKCPRHNGWQNIRDLDVQVEVDSKNSTIKQLTDRERELRRRIEDINPPSTLVKQYGGRFSGKKKHQGNRSSR